MTSSIEANGEATIRELTRIVQEFADAREWNQFHDPKNLVMALSSEVGELASILRWVRSEDSDAFAASGKQHDQLRVEIGDVGICLLLLCARANVDLGAAVVDKVKANAAKYPVATSFGRADPPST
jgi:NTP pyrophosphatase (non-canonical NTP hydrolase)